VDSTDPDTVAGKKVNGKNVNFRIRSAEEWDRVMDETPQQKIAQALLSRNGEYIVVESGHEIHLYQPGWVVEAIRQVVEAARKQTRLTPP
jgi:hypothetical protein